MFIYNFVIYFFQYFLTNPAVHFPPPRPRTVSASPVSEPALSPRRAKDDTAKLPQSYGRSPWHENFPDSPAHPVFPVPAASVPAPVPDFHPRTFPFGSFPGIRKYAQSALHTHPITAAHAYPQSRCPPGLPPAPVRWRWRKRSLRRRLRTRSLTHAPQSCNFHNPAAPRACAGL